MKKITYISLFALIIFTFHHSRNIFDSDKRSSISSRQLKTAFISKKEYHSNRNIIVTDEHKLKQVQVKENFLIESDERKIEDITHDLKWLKVEWEKYLYIVLREELNIDQQVVENYYELNIIYSSRIKEVSQLIKESKDVLRNMNKIIHLQKEYEKKRIKILGLETIEIINNRYIKEFNHKNSYLTRNNTGISSF